MKLRPVNKRILVEQIKETTTDSGLILEDSNQELILKGKVIEIGEGVTIKVTQNQFVYFNQTLADKVKIDDITSFLVKEEDVIAVLD